MTDKININIKFSIPNENKVDYFIGMPTDVASIVIPTLISLLVFAIGILINSYVKRKEKRNKVESVKSTVFTWCNLLENPVLSQAQFCRVFANRLLTNTHVVPEPINFNVIPAANLTSIDINSYVDTFVTNYSGDQSENSKHIFNLVNQLQLIDRVHKDIEVSYFKYQDEVNRLMHEWNSKFEELDKLNDSYDKEVKKNQSHQYYPLLVKINGIAKKWLEHPNQPIPILATQNELLDKIESACFQELNQDPSHEYAIKYSQIIRNLKIIISNWHMNNVGTRTQYLNSASTLVTAIKIIRQSISGLQEHDVNSVWIIK